MRPVRADLVPFFLRQFVDPKIKVVGDLDFAGAHLAVAAAEPRLALGHQHELDAEGVDELLRPRLRSRFGEFDGYRSRRNSRSIVLDLLRRMVDRNGGVRELDWGVPQQRASTEQNSSG